MSYAPFNSTYKSYSTSNNQYSNNYKNKNVIIEDDSYSFSKHQDNMGFEGDDYYCGQHRSVLGKSTEIRDIFLSSDNMAILQQLIKREIYKRSKGKFRMDIDQDENDLLICMDAIFLEYCKHLPNNIKGQINELNKKTIEIIIPGMLTNIKSNYYYVKQLDKPIIPLPQPLNVNRAGRKTLPSTTSVWGF
jgi:hypothetical protein